MKRWLFVSVIPLPLLALIWFGFSGASRVTQNPKIARGKAVSGPTMKVEVTPWGPTQEMLDAAGAKLAEQPDVQAYLKGTRNRLLSMDLIVDDEKGSVDPPPPSRYRATFYDYTNDQTIIAESSFDNPDSVKVKTSSVAPLPSNDELDEATEILKSDPKLGPAILDERLQVYRAMPPLYFPEESKGKVERLVNVGLMAKVSSDKSLARRNEVVAVNLSRGTVVRFASGAPPTSKAGPAASCGSAASGSSTGRGIAGQYQFIINDGDGNQLWSFLAIRPSASSGTDASGIELQKVRFRGKLVLKRAHVPILNVNYDNDTCGPFRDWEYAESQFSADPTNGTNVAPGVRSCTVPATTQLDTDVDSGNFQGIAFYEQGDAIILVSEMSAGWYRYISEWGFHKDGTISPRFGMGATVNSCTCNAHVHRAYWRLDFDVNGASPNRILEASGTSKPTPINNGITTEIKRYRDKKSIYWTIENTNTRDSYSIRPSVNDGTALNEAYGKGDLWFLSYNPAEIDDSAVRTNTSANLDAFVNNQTVVDTDIVVWYAIHINHNRPGGQMMGHPNISGLMVAGPDLVPVRW